MAKYKVIRDCHGFQGRLWKQGEIVEVGEKEGKPPKHFALLRVKKVEELEEAVEHEEAASSESEDSEKEGEVPGVRSKKPKRGNRR